MRLVLCLLPAEALKASSRRRRTLFFHVAGVRKKLRCCAGARIETHLPHTSRVPASPGDRRNVRRVAGDRGGVGARRAGARRLEHPGAASCPRDANAGARPGRSDAGRKAPPSLDRDGATTARVVLGAQGGLQPAELWQRQGRTSDAISVLATVQDRFTEGFETADLVRSASLLSTLRSSIRTAPLSSARRAHRRPETPLLEAR